MDAVVVPFQAPGAVDDGPVGSRCCRRARRDVHVAVEVLVEVVGGRAGIELNRPIRQYPPVGFFVIPEHRDRLAAVVGQDQPVGEFQDLQAHAGHAWSDAGDVGAVVVVTPLIVDRVLALRQGSLRVALRMGRKRKRQQQGAEHGDDGTTGHGRAPRICACTGKSRAHHSRAITPGRDRTSLQGTSSRRPDPGGKELARRVQRRWRAHRQRTADQAAAAHGHEHHATVRGHRGTWARPACPLHTTKSDQDTLTRIAPHEQRDHQQDRRRQVEQGVDHEK